MKKTPKQQGTLVRLPGPVTRSLTEQAGVIRRNYRVRSGRAVILEGIAQGVFDAGLRFDDCATVVHVADKIRTALTNGDQPR